MSLSRCRKLSQPPQTGTAVNTIHSGAAEPERSTAFAYLQIHAQVVHRSLSRRSSPPASLDFFSGRGMGSPRLLRSVVTAPQSSGGSIGQAPALICRGLVRCSTLGKIKSGQRRLPPLARIQGYRSSFIEMYLLICRDPLLESFKVIAFDKTYVNKKFSSRNYFPYIPY